MRSPSNRLRAEYSPQQQQFAWLPWPFAPFCPWHPAAFQRPQEALELPPLLSVLRLGQLWPSVSSWPAHSNSRARARMRSARHLCLHSSHNHRRVDAATELIWPDRQPGIKSQYELPTVGFGIRRGILLSRPRSDVPAGLQLPQKVHLVWRTRAAPPVAGIRTGHQCNTTVCAQIKVPRPSFSFTSKGNLFAMFFVP